MYGHENERHSTTADENSAVESLLSETHRTNLLHCCCFYLFISNRFGLFHNHEKKRKVAGCLCSVLTRRRTTFDFERSLMKTQGGNLPVLQCCCCCCRRRRYLIMSNTCILFSLLQTKKTSGAKDSKLNLSGHYSQGLINSAVLKHP